MHAVAPSSRIDEIMVRVCQWPAEQLPLTRWPRGPVPAAVSGLSWPRIHPERSVAPGRSWPAAAARPCGLARDRGGPVRWRGASFFICQFHLPQHDVDRLHGTLQSRASRNSFKVRSFFLASRARIRLWWAATIMGLRRQSDAAQQCRRCVALLQELLDHAQGDPEPMGNLVTSSLGVVIGRQDSFAQIQR